MLRITGDTGNDGEMNEESGSSKEAQKKEANIIPGTKDPACTHECEYYTEGSNLDPGRHLEKALILSYTLTPPS